MAIIWNQKVEMTWVGSVKKYYESILDNKGKQKYKYTKQYDKFLVDMCDLPVSSCKTIKAQCDYCGDIVNKVYRNFNLEYKRNDVPKTACKHCQGKKVSENFDIGYDELKFDVNEEYKPIGDRHEYNRYDLIKLFWKFVEEFKYYPKFSDFNNSKKYPKASHYRRIWGSWKNLMNDFGLLSDDDWFKHDVDVLKKCYEDQNYLIRDINNSLMVKRNLKQLKNKACSLNLFRKDFFQKREYDVTEDKISSSSMEAIKDLYFDLGKCPNVEEYEEYSKLNNLLHRKALEKAVGKKFSEICSGVLEQNNKTIKTKDQLIRELDEVRSKIGRVPKASELQAYGLSEHKAYLRKFNMNYVDIIDMLGWDHDLVYNKKKSDEEMLGDYVELYNEIGRLPLRLDLDKSSITSTSNSYLRRFGDLKQLWDILDLDYTVKDVFNLGRGYTCLDDDGELCKSEMERLITNIFIKNNIKFNKEIKYKDVNKSLKRNWVMDWYFPDQKIIVEYFGMWSKESLHRNTAVGKYSRKVLNKQKFCKENNIKLISILPHDITNTNSEKFLNKFDEHGMSLII